LSLGFFTARRRVPRLVAGISCVINRRGLPAYAIDPPRVCRQTLAHPLADGIDGTLRAKGDEKNERLAASLLLSIRDDIWTRLGMSLTDCRCAWARSSLRLRRFRPFRAVRRIPQAYESTSRCLRFGLSHERFRTDRNYVSTWFPSWYVAAIQSVFQECEHVASKFCQRFGHPLYFPRDDPFPSTDARDS